MRIPKLVTLGGFALAQVLPLSLSAQTSDPALLRRLDELEQELRVLKRQTEIDKETAADKPKTSTSVSLGASGLNIQSADSNYVFKVRGYVQADARFYADDVSPQNDTFLLRRVRPIFEGTVAEKFDYRLMLDFGSGQSLGSGNNGLVQDAYVNARFLPELQLQVGKFKEPVGLERLQSGANLLFVERAYPTQLLPNRDVGVQLHGSLGRDLVNYAVGVFNGVPDGGSTDFDTNDDDKDVAARIFVHPFKNTEIDGLRGLGFGVAGTVGNQEGSLRSYSSPGQQRIFAYRSGDGTASSPNVVADGDHWRVSPQFYYYWGPFGLLGEYALSSQQLHHRAGNTSARDTIAHEAWQIAGSYFLTGEDNSFKSVAPRKAFRPSEGGWGALELKARYSQIEFDPEAFPLYASSASSARRAQSWAVGVNWHLNRNIKVSLDYEHTEFDYGFNGGLLEKGEQVFLSRAQFSF